MAIYSLPSIYLGSDAEARELFATVKAIPRKTPDLFTSQNDFLKHCVLFTMENDPQLKSVMRLLNK